VRGVEDLAPEIANDGPRDVVFSASEAPKRKQFSAR
jgi:hypothetical protein